MERTELVYKKAEGMSPYSYAVVGEWLYFCDYFFPVLFRYHFKEQRTERVAIFDKGWLNQRTLRIYHYQNELWLLPFMAGNIICFHINTKEVEYYEIPPEVESRLLPFDRMFFEGVKAYIVPYRNNGILMEVDLQTRIVRKVCLLERKQKGEKVYFNGAVHYRNHLYLMELSKNVLVLFNMENGEIKHVHPVGSELGEFCPIGMGDSIYFFPIAIKGNEDLLIYDINTNELMKKEYPIKSLSKGEVCINVAWNEEVWILANKRKKIYRVGKTLEVVSEISMLNFNDKEEQVYATGRSFDNCMLWGGYSGTPLIQVKNEDIKILDVGVKKTELEMYIEIVGKCNTCKDELGHISVGKSIYRNIVSDYQ